MSEPRMIRGGFYYVGTRILRTSYRVWDGPEVRSSSNGFRLVVKRRKQ
jgi:formylglycine-generating enzyme required for sulfatase activity